MQHQTPQFIDIEDKVVGPLSVKQAIYLAGGAGIIFLLYRFTPFLIFLILATPVAALVWALAFYKHNERPFVFLLESGFKYLVNSRLYLWRHRKPEDIAKENQSVEVPQKNQAINPASGLGSSKLKNLSWNLEVSEDDKVF